MGDGGFEPPKALPADLQSVPFGHSGNPPNTICKFKYRWSWWTDSNPRPADYKSAALPTELHQHLARPQQRLFYQKGVWLSTRKIRKCRFSFGEAVTRSGRIRTDPLRDVQREAPKAWCCRCGGELYRWDRAVPTAAGPLCAGCAWERRPREASEKKE